MSRPSKVLKAVMDEQIGTQEEEAEIQAHIRKMNAERWIKLTDKQLDNLETLIKTSDLTMHGMARCMGITPYYLERYMRWFVTEGRLSKKEWVERFVKQARSEAEQAWGALFGVLETEMAETGKKR